MPGYEGINISIVYRYEGINISIVYRYEGSDEDTVMWYEGSDEDMMAKRVVTGHSQIHTVVARFLYQKPACFYRLQPLLLEIPPDTDQTKRIIYRNRQVDI